MAGLLVFLSHQTRSKKNKTIIISIQDHYPRKIRIEFLSRFDLKKSEGEREHKTRETEKEGKRPEKGKTQKPERGRTRNNKKRRERIGVPSTRIQQKQTNTHLSQKSHC